MALRRVPIFLDDFGDGNQDLPVLSGNGSVLETGGALVVSCTAGQNMDWRNGKVPYVGVDPQEAFTRIYYEFTVRSWTPIGSTAQVWGILHQNDSNLYFIYSSDAVNFYAYKIIGGTWTLVGGPIATSLPRKFRMVWDRSLSTIGFQCQTGISPPVWTNIVADQAMQISPTKFGLTVRNWSPYPAATAQFEDVEVYADEFSETNASAAALEDDANVPEQGDFALGYLTKGDLNSNDTGLTSGFEDQGGLIPVAGHQVNPGTGLGEGQLMEEPEGFEDIVSFPSAGGTPDYVTGVPEGFLSSDPRDPAGLEEKCYAETAAPTYVQGIPDGDGREFLGGTHVYDLQAYFTDSESWDSPLPGGGFYGIARNGTIYNDGYATGPTLNGTSFGTLAAGFNTRTWATDREPQGINAWHSNYTMSLVADDKVRITGAGHTDWRNKGCGGQLRWFLTGNFDVEVSFENYSSSGGSDGGFWIEAIVDYASYIYCRRQKNGIFDSDVKINNGWVSYVSAAGATNSGRLRIVRSGTSMSTYYDKGAGWVLLHSAYSNSVFAKPMFVHIGAGGVGNLNLTVDFFGFQINSGTTINTAGWYREAAGTYRGSRADFPQSALVATSGGSVDIIDRDNDRLWMRFVAGTNNALHNAGIEVRRLRMLDGMLLLAYQNGGGVCVDFTTDDIRIHSASSETWTGAILRANNGVYDAPTDSSGRDIGAVGIVACRNLGRAYSGDHNNWQIPSTSAFDIDMYENDGYLYKVHATASGMGAHKWHRWYNDRPVPNNWWNPGVGKSGESSAMYWCEITSDGTLFYLSPSSGTNTIYSADFSNWSTKLNTSSVLTWSADHSLSLPGTRTIGDTQNGAAIVGVDIFLPADEGVYRSVWPGAFSLAYGSAESSATYPILPGFNTIVRSIRAIKDDGGNDLLAVGCEFVHDRISWGQVALIDPATNGLYALLPATPGRSIQAVAQ